MATSPTARTVPSVHTIDTDIWAKWGSGGDGPYPLVAHLLDTAIVAEHLWDHWLSHSARAALTAQLQAPDQEARRCLARLAGLHDLGKANPVFQGQLARSECHPSDFAAHLARLADSGYWPGDGVQATRPLLRRHEAVTGAYLADHTYQDGYADLPDSVVLSGHHGHYRLAHDPSYDADYLLFHDGLQRGWRPQAAAHRALIEQFTGGHPLPPHTPAHLLPILTGFVCLADWVASTEHAVVAGHRTLKFTRSDWTAFAHARRDYLRDRILELGTPTVPSGSFADTFGFLPDRPVQDALLDLTGAGLTIAAVPMGEGKTEAALGRWQRMNSGRRLYFALPTMATADAMLDRVRAFLDGTPNLGTLSHSRALLNAFYQPAPDRGPHLGATGAHPGSGLQPGSWFTGRHRALFSPIAVGTLDQLLSGVLRHKYNFMRLLGAFDATLVLDEVHSYDPYMGELLTRLLTWCGALGVDVVLLSATLPNDQMRSYLNAYRAGLRLPALAADDVPAAYPLVLHQPQPAPANASATATQPRARALADLTPAARRTFDVDYVTVAADTGIATTAEIARARLRAHPGCKVGLIVNTVARAQALAATLADSDTPVHLLHSRMTATQRSRTTQDALSAFGKAAAAGSAILVATQVAEQSLDIDLDTLITDLAPAPALIQRAGRVWRHITTNPARGPLTRPGHLPRLTVLRPDQITFGSALPYPDAQLTKTWARGLDNGTRRTLAVADIQTIVDASHVTWADLHADLTTADQSAERHLAQVAAQRIAASTSALPQPQHLRVHQLDTFTSDAALGSEYTDTRWNADLNVTVLLLSETQPDACHPRHLREHPTRSDLLALLGATVPLTGRSARTVLAHLETGRTSIRRAPDSPAMLRDLVVVDLDADDVASWLTLDPFLGVQVVT